MRSWEHRPSCTRLNEVEAVREDGGSLAVVRAAGELPVQFLGCIPLLSHLPRACLEPGGAAPAQQEAYTQWLPADPPWSQP